MSSTVRPHSPAPICRLWADIVVTGSALFTLVFTRDFFFFFLGGVGSGGGGDGEEKGGGSGGEAEVVYSAKWDMGEAVVNVCDHHSLASAHH